ncbi:PIN domain-containing protein [Paracoccus rhizosphaerae]|uniref:PIN domain-containing protein n=1 Tax=Paracoccus rhizosphaerae TaxID=1133347 RepID=A0ABV6CM76_9RHOB|nr:hypothetical protein [Paracoccus rhizosphaerae]
MPDDFDRIDAVATIWKVAIKRGLKRSTCRSIGASCEPACWPTTIANLPSKVAFSTLPPLHDDPSDRLLLAQAVTDGLILLSGNWCLWRPRRTGLTGPDLSAQDGNWNVSGGASLVQSASGSGSWAI